MLEEYFASVEGTPFTTFTAADITTDLNFANVEA